MEELERPAVQRRSCKGGRGFFCEAGRKCRVLLQVLGLRCQHRGGLHPQRGLEARVECGPETGGDRSSLHGRHAQGRPSQGGAEQAGGPEREVPDTSTRRGRRLPGGSSPGGMRGGGGEPWRMCGWGRFGHIVSPSPEDREWPAAPGRCDAAQARRLARVEGGAQRAQGPAGRTGKASRRAQRQGRVCGLVRRRGRVGAEASGGPGRGHQGGGDEAHLSLRTVPGACAGATEPRLPWRGSLVYGERGVDAAHQPPGL